MRIGGIARALLAAVFVFVLVIAGSIFYLKHHLADITKSKLQNYVSKTFNAKFEIGSIEFNLPYEAAIGDMFVETEDIILSVNDMVVYFNPIKFLKSGNAADSITSIDLFSPRLVFKHSGALSAPAGLTGGLSNGGKFQIYWEEGYVTLPRFEPEQVMRLRKSFKVLKLFPEEAFLKRNVIKVMSGFLRYKNRNISSEAAFNDNLTMDMKYSLLNKHINGKLYLKNYELTQLLGLMQRKNNVNAQGRFDSTISLEGPLSGLKWEFDYSTRDNISVNGTSFSTSGKGNYASENLAVSVFPPDKKGGAF